MKRGQKTEVRGTQRDGRVPKGILSGKKPGPEERTQTRLNKQLLDAAEKGDLEKVKGALNDGADVNATSTNGYTPLMWAVMRERTDVVKLLIDKGANVNAKNDNGTSVLKFAKDNMVPMLRKAGADMRGAQSMEFSPEAGC